MADDPKEQGRLVAIVLPTLFAGPATDASVRDKRIIETAQEWQKMSVWAHMVEIHGMTHGIPEGRLTETIGRMAATGEQLGLASTCSRDARRWLAQPSDTISGPIAARSLAEITGYYTLSSGHGLANITLRTLLLDVSAAASLNAKYKEAAGFPPFTDDRAAWRPLSHQLVEALRNAAQVVQQPTVSSLVGVLADLVTDPRWIALEARRGADFHRWRPQSIAGGVPQKSPWSQLPHGQRSMTVGISNGFVPPDHEALVTEADDALDALTAAMDEWMALFPSATRDLGVPLFATEEA